MIKITVFFALCTTWKCSATCMYTVKIPENWNHQGHHYSILA